METKEYWNDSHGKQNQNPPSEWVIKVEKEFPRNSKVLDLGGGQGRDAIYMNELGHNVIILDISETAKTHFELNNLDIEYIVHDLSNLPYPFADNSFDVIYSRLALHYFDTETMIGIYKELIRIIKPNGKVFISVKSVNDTQEMKSLRQEGVEVEPGLFSVQEILKARYSHEQIKKQVIESGISNFNIQDVDENLRSANQYGHESLLVTEIIFEK